MLSNLAKRRFLSIAAYSAIATPAIAVRAQEIEEIDPLEILEATENIHSNFLFAVRDTIVNGDLLSRASLEVPIGDLLQREVLEQSDAAAISSIIDGIFSSESLEEADDFFESFVESIENPLNALGQALVWRIRETFQVAKELFSGVEWESLLRMVAHDIRGALDGAVAGAELGSRLGGLGRVGGAIVGGLGGAVAASTLGFFDESPT
jgi:hypothetical protein